MEVNASRYLLSTRKANTPRELVSGVSWPPIPLDESLPFVLIAQKLRHPSTLGGVGGRGGGESV